jgi:hypothetical protein
MPNKNRRNSQMGDQFVSRFIRRVKGAQRPWSPEGLKSIKMTKSDKMTFGAGQAGYAIGTAVRLTKKGAAARKKISKYIKSIKK